MTKKELIKKYYKTNTVVHWSDNRYSKEYVEWLERKLLILLNQNKDENNFSKLKVGDRVKTKSSGIGTVLEIGCYNNTMVKLKCDKKKWYCPYFYENELELKQNKDDE